MTIEASGRADSHGTRENVTQLRKHFTLNPVSWAKLRRKISQNQDSY